MAAAGAGSCRRCAAIFVQVGVHCYLGVLGARLRGSTHCKPRSQSAMLYSVLTEARTFDTMSAP